MVQDNFNKIQFNIKSPHHTMKKYIQAFILSIVIAYIGNAQSFTVQGPRTIFELPANKGTGKYTFFNLDSGKEIATADSNSTKWDIAFSKTTVIINGGASGPGSVSAQVLSTTSFATLTTVPTTGYVADGTSKAVSGWYTYNYVPADNGPHSITMNADKIIAVKLADGRYAKIQLLNYYKGIPTNIPTTGPVYTGVGAYISFRYLITDAASTDLSKLTTTVKNLYANNGSHYQFFNLASGDTTIVADSNSTKWDMAFKATTVLINSGISGPDKDSAQIAATDFTSVTTAPSLNWKSDEAGGKAVAGWYNYDPNSHIISVADDKTYIIKLSNGRYAKLVFDSYYQNNNTAGTSRYYSFTYYFEPTGLTDLTAAYERETEAPVTTGILGAVVKSATIYPNPLSAVNTTLSVQSAVNTGTVKIVDVLGNQVYTAAITDTTTQLTNVNLTKGFYLVVVESNGSVFQQKLIVE